MQYLTDTELHVQARKRVEFKRHLLVYCIVNGSLWMIWALTSRGYLWPVWPLFGWGIGLIFHYLFDYRSSRFLSEEEEFNKLKQETQEFDRHKI